MRVMSEPVEKSSVCSNEKCMIRLKQPLRRSLPQLCPATLVHTAESSPNTPPARTTSSMRTPVERIRLRFETPLFPTPRMPSSTITAIIRGWYRST